MVRINPRVRWRWEKDKVILNNLMILNETAGTILESLHKTEDIASAAEQIHQQFPDIPSNKIYKDVSTFVEILQQWNIVIPEDSEEYWLKVCPEYMKMIAVNFQNVLSAPLEVSCEVTSACNAKCMHCLASSAHNQRDLTTHEWEKIIDEIAQINVFSVLLTGGEPLLRKDLEQLVKKCASKGIITGVSTNGYLLSESRIESLSSAGVAGFAISLDGIDAETHDTFRGVKGLYHKVMDAITILVGRKIECSVLISINKMNITQIIDMVQFLDNMGVSQIPLLRFKLLGRAQENSWLEPDAQDYIRLLKEVSKVEKELSNALILYPDLPMKFFEKSIGVDVYEQLRKEGKVEVCGAGIISCTLGPSGDIKPCDVSGDVSLGNIKEAPLKDIWDNSEVFKKLRTLGKKNQKPCNACTFNEVCLTGCKALPSQIGDNGDICTADPICVKCFNTFKEEVVQ